MVVPRFAFAADEKPASTVKSDETVILFPTIAQLPKGKEVWEIDLHGWIFEGRHFGNIRDLWTRFVSDDDELEEEGADLDDDEVPIDSSRSPTSQPAAARFSKREILKQRSHFFLVDNERGKRIAVRLAGQRFVTEASAPSGHFHGAARLDRRDLNDHLPVRKPDKVERDLVIPVSVALSDDDARQFVSSIFLLNRRGISVVSDIDDTIKITECMSKRACTRNTFLLPFRAVPGMSELYQDWSHQGATIHYVSACPWQLYEPLRVFMADAGFPSGPMVMKEFRWKDRTVFDMFDSPEEYKVSRIGVLLERFPDRRFILVGDSGQSDPEAYGALARRFPKQVKRILIRSVPGSQKDYATAFRDLPRDKWQIFIEPNEIKGSLDALLSAGSNDNGAGSSR